MADFDCVVVGAGAVGLACAAEIARRGKSILILERHAQTGQETSSRNSGVVHAGIYYPQGSLKATLCVRGRQLLYERCEAYAIPHNKLGKLIVSTTPEETRTLESIQSKAADNGVALYLLDETELRRREPELRACAALWSPETGIVDAHELMYSYHKEATDHGAVLCLNTELVALEHAGGQWRVSTRDTAGEETTVTATWVVNCAGLAADRVAALAGLDVVALGWKLHWCKGDYFALAPKHCRRVSHLVYPVPAQAGLGVHLTFDLGGALLAGPDAQYVTELTYDVDPAKAEPFSAAVQRYLPGVGPEDLTPGYAGMRPKLQGPGETFRDFVIEDAAEHGLPQLVNLIGIESPGLTAAGAIAERVAEMVRSR